MRLLENFHREQEIKSFLTIFNEEVKAPFPNVFLLCLSLLNQATIISSKSRESAMLFVNKMKYECSQVPQVEIGQLCNLISSISIENPNIIKALKIFNCCTGEITMISKRIPSDFVICLLYINSTHLLNGTIIDEFLQNEFKISSTYNQICKLKNLNMVMKIANRKFRQAKRRRVYEHAVNSIPNIVLSKHSHEQSWFTLCQEEGISNVNLLI